MKKYISFYYGYQSNYNSRISMIKDTGFDGVMALYKYSKTFFQECDALQKSGLVIDSLHLPFHGIVNKLWLSENQSSKFINEMQDGIDYAASIGIDKVTIHTSATKLPPPKKSIAIERINNLCEYAEQKKVRICIENLRRKDYFLYIMNNVSNNNCKICFDVGHMNAFWAGRMNSFGASVDMQKVICCHLHDNNGIFDSHLPPYDGSINWSEVNHFLKIMALDGLTAEVFANKKTIRTTAEYAYLKHVYNALRRIEKGMNDYEL